jgi:hypothetical protein
MVPGHVAALVHFQCPAAGWARETIRPSDRGRRGREMRGIAMRAKSAHIGAAGFSAVSGATR